MAPTEFGNRICNSLNVEKKILANFYFLFKTEAFGLKNLSR